MDFLKSLDQVFSSYEDINADIVLLYNLITTFLQLTYEHILYHMVWYSIVEV